VDDIARLELKDDPQPASANGLADQLITVMIGFVPPDLEIRKEALNGFLECDLVNRQFVLSKSYSKSYSKSAGVKRCQLGTVCLLHKL